MVPEPSSQNTNPASRLQREVRRKEHRKLRARKEGERCVWFGLGMFGLVGWSIAVPTVIGIMMGLYIDSHFKSRASWTLMLLFLGVVIGCVNAWYWVKRETEPLSPSQQAPGEEHRESK